MLCFDSPNIGSLLDDEVFVTQDDSFPIASELAWWRGAGDC